MHVMILTHSICELIRSITSTLFISIVWTLAAVVVPISIDTIGTETQKEKKGKHVEKIFSRCLITETILFRIFFLDVPLLLLLVVCCIYAAHVAHLWRWNRGGVAQVFNGVRSSLAYAMNNKQRRRFYGHFSGFWSFNQVLISIKNSPNSTID